MKDKDSLIQQCLDILKREDIKYKLKCTLGPVINLLLNELNIYIYLIIGLIFLIFILNLAILICVLRNKI